MKKILQLITKLFTPKPLTRFAKNSIGYSNGYSGCPNCGDSWMWKPSGSITYNKTGAKYGITGYHVMICTECLSAPGRLSTKNILDSLSRYDWEEDKLEQVKVAIENYKASHEDSEFHENCPAT